MFKKKLFFLFFLPFIPGLFMLSGCSITTPVAVTVTGVTLDQVTLNLTVGGATGTLVATVAPVNATNQSVNWSSSAPAVATVVNGIVTPLTAGTATMIVATVDGGLTAICAVTVNPLLVAVGDSYGGGIVAYILQSEDPGYNASVQHGLIAATADQSVNMAWSNITNVLIGTTETAIGTGPANTTAIVNQAGCTSGAAYLCYYLTEGGYSDWYLPSKDELNQLYLNRALIGGFVVDVNDNPYYWSSSEHNDIDEFNEAWEQGFDDGYQYFYADKSYTDRVRAVRSF